MRKLIFWKISLFQKCTFSEKVDAVQKYLLWKSSSFLDIFILSSSSEKKAIPKSNCKEPPILNKWLFYRIFAPKKKLKQLLQKSDCSEKGENNSCSELPQKSNCCVEVVTLKKREELASTKIKLSWKVATYARREIVIWKKETQIRLAITFNFFQEVPSPL